MSINDIVKQYTQASESAESPETPDADELAVYRQQLEAIDEHLADAGFDRIGYLDFQSLHELLINRESVDLSPDKGPFPGAAVYLMNPRELLAQQFIALCQRADRQGALSPADIMEHAAEVLPQPVKDDPDEQ